MLCNESDREFRNFPPDKHDENDVKDRKVTTKNGAIFSAIVTRIYY